MIPHLIDGRRVESAATFMTLNPSNNEPIAEVASGGEAEIAAAVAAAKAAFPKWAGMPAPRRARLIRKLGELIEKTCTKSRRWNPPTPARASRAPRTC